MGAHFPGQGAGGAAGSDAARHRRVAGREGTPCFIPVHVNCYAMGLEGVQEIVDGLDRARYEVLLPTAFLELAARARGMQPA